MAFDPPISFYIVAKNEIYWIEPCILSIADLANEIIFVDNGSTDGTQEKVKKIKDKYNLNIHLYNAPEIVDLADLRNFAISKCSNKFIFVWDADFVAFEDSSEHSLKKQLCYLKENKAFEKYHRFMCKIPVMRTFLGQTWINSHIHPPNCVIFHKDYLQKVIVSSAHGWDERIWKNGCKTFDMSGYYFISVDIKSDLHFVSRAYRSKWRLFRRKNNSQMELFVYLEKILKKSVSSLVIELYSKRTKEFPYAVPIWLKNFIENPPYTLEYKGGVVVGRQFDYERLQQLELKS